jgi:PAS domain S-box-containing protein
MAKLQRFWWSRVSLLTMAGVAAIYYFSAQLGFKAAFPEVADQVTAVWPPAGIALSALLIFGSRFWPGVAVGAFLANYVLRQEPLFIAAGIALGNSLEAVLGAWLLRRAGFRGSLERVKDVVVLAALAAGLSTTVSATIGAICLCLGGLSPWSAFGSIWSVWWVGDAMGDLVMAPVILTWVCEPRLRLRPRRLLEATGLLLLLAAIGFIVSMGRLPNFLAEYSLQCIMFPLVIWAAMRMGPRDTTLVILASCTVAILTTLKDLGPFVRASGSERLVFLETFLGIFTLTGLLLAAATAERQTTERRRAAGYAVTRILGESASLAEAKPILLAALCERLEWDLGMFFRLDPENLVLVPEERWPRPPGDAGDHPLAVRHPLPPELRPPGGLLGRAGEVPTLELTRATSRFLASLAPLGGLRQGFGFPLVVEGKVLGVAGFFRRSGQEADEDLLRMAVAIAIQVGLYSERKETEESLRQKHAILKAVTEGTTDAVYVKDLRGRYLMINDAGAHSVGKTVEEMLGRDDEELFPPEMGREFREHDRRILAEGKVDTCEEVANVGGARLIFHSTKGPYRDHHGKVVGLIGISRDITERKLAEEERARLLARAESLREDAETAEKRAAFLAEVSSILASSMEDQSTLLNVAGLAVPEFADSCSIHFLKEDGTLECLAVARENGTTQAEVEDFRQSYPLPGMPSPALARVLKTGRPELNPEPGDLEMEAKGAARRHLEILRRLSPSSSMVVPLLAQGRVLGTLVFNVSLTRRRYGPTDLSFAEEVARRTALAVDSARLYREAHRSNQLKDEFLAMLAHELRNPLAPALNAMEIMKQYPAEDDALRMSRDILERQVLHMARLLEDLLDVSRITRGKIMLRKEDVELGGVVRRAVESIRPLLQQQRHRISVSLPPDAIYLEADPIRIEQVLVNLLNNAAKYTDEGGHLSLSVERAGGEACIKVEDSGRGIPREMLPRIFDLFVQSDRALDRSQGGLGIGLTIVRSLVEMHGGTVEARSDGPGKGSTFIVRLPILGRLPTVMKDRVASPAEDAGRPLRILVVDDNVDMAQTTALLLNTLGHDVRVAYDGPQALEVAASHRPEVVLLDIGLPGMDGYVVAKELRQRGLEKSLLVAVSGYGQEEDRRRSREAGFDHHLMKPVEFSNLLLVLKGYGSSSRSGVRNAQ